MIKATFRSISIVKFVCLILTAIDVRAAQPVRDSAAELQPKQAQMNYLKEIRNMKVPMFLHIARNADGSVKYMNQNQAIQYCLGQGAHLPSAREWAQYSFMLVAEGILEVDFVDSNLGGRPPVGYSLINAKDFLTGSSDAFYFNLTGYQRPEGELGDNWFFWS